jgi:RNA polymerase sigma factor (sigma-70 family)
MLAGWERFVADYRLVSESDMFPLFSQPDPAQVDEFNAVLRDHGDAAYRMACQLTGGKEAEARDLVQEAFVRIWRNWKTHRPDSINGWMRTVLHNLYMDVLRRQARRPSVSLDPGDGAEFSLSDILPDPHPSLETLYHHHELQKTVAEALSQLDVEFRIPVVLCDMEGMSYEEIAQIVSCPVGTVRSRIHRGRSRLRQLLRSLEPLEARP